MNRAQRRHQEHRKAQSKAAKKEYAVTVTVRAVPIEGCVIVDYTRPTKAIKMPALAAFQHGSNIMKAALLADPSLAVNVQAQVGEGNGPVENAAGAEGQASCAPDGEVPGAQAPAATAA